jgi:hypothetical protein
MAAYIGYARKPDPFDVLFAKGGLVKGPYSKPLALALGGVFDSATPAIIGEAGREVVIPLSRPNRALQLARESGLIDVLAAGARAQSSTMAGTVAAGPDTAGPFRGGPGNTYNIYGVTMDQIIAEIEARDSAALRVRR